MKLANRLMSWGAQVMIEWPVRKLTIQELISQLEQSALEIMERLKASTDSPDNRRELCHIIGIERWGQRRLRVALGEPFLAEEYDHYRPSFECSWDDLTKDWDATRQGTLSLAMELDKAHTSPELTINHNMYGPLSVKGWLRYLDLHASSEGKRVK
jgi:hypothetical protein